VSARVSVRTALRVLVLLLVASALLGGIGGGLTRAGVFVPHTADAEWLGRAALGHAALMMCGFLGTVIGVERAVAIRRRAALLAPLSSAAGAVCLLLGHPAWNSWLLVVAAAAFAAASLVVVRRQREAHTLLLLVAALAWGVGNLLFAAGRESGAVLPWWFAFLVVTIAAERLEMARLMHRGAATRVLMVAAVCTLLAGAALSAATPPGGGLLYGAGLILLAAWLGLFDIARRTVFAHGLSRYMALCLLGGYAWLAIAGVAWGATALGWPARDAALHALGLGFIVSMVMGHAPVILPAVTHVKLRFSGWFYVPLAALHLSLVLRLGPGAFDPPLRALGAALNAMAIALFAITVAWAARRAASAQR